LIREEGGYTLVELLTVMAILGVILGAIVTLFTAGINADADQNRRYQAQQDAKVALDKMRREGHSACTVSAPATYNTWMSSVTFYYPSDTCGSGTHSITWCTKATGSTWALYRAVATSCPASPTQAFASNLTSANIFAYLPPGSHLVSSSTVGQGTAATYIVTQDGSNVLPRLHIDMNINVSASKSRDAFHLMDDIAFRNGPRACNGAATC
jgi:prepilin-type N-terminal cleavage/methylation domain-containing protein